MKKVTLIFTILCIAVQLHAQDCKPSTPVITADGSLIICDGGSVNLSTGNGNDWTKKKDFGGVVRFGAVGFSIGPKGYIGTGYNGTTNYQDFWEYDPATDAWSQKANFAGAARRDAVGFSIGKLGFVGTGYNGITYFNDFWQYSVATNTWLNRAAFPGVARKNAVGFNVGTLGYVGTGLNGATNFKDFYSYSAATNIWTIRTSFGGTARNSAVGFGTTNKGYIGTGWNLSTYYKDFWEYDPATNLWIQKTDFSGSARLGAMGFGIGNRGYIGTGITSVGALQKDFREYDPATDAWTVRTSFPGVPRAFAVGFSIGSRGYCGTGSNGSSSYKDFWEYEPAVSLLWSTGATTASIDVSTAGTYSVTATNHLGCDTFSSAMIVAFFKPPTATMSLTGTINICQGSNVTITAGVGNSWLAKANFGGTARDGATGFSIGSKGYIGTGNDGTGFKNDFWEYNSITNVWTQKANFGGSARGNAVGFCIGNKGYIGTGINAARTNDFWEYDPSLNIWVARANFPGTARYRAVGFSIGPFGYIGTGGTSAGNASDFYQYNPTTDSWQIKAAFGGGPRVAAVGFSIGSKGYVGTGSLGTAYFDDFWEYDPATNTWTARANVGGGLRRQAVGFNIGSNGYIGTGFDGTTFKTDFREYDPVTNVWQARLDFGGGICREAVGFGIGNKGYIGTGTATGTTYEKDFWVYTPAYDYQWSTGSTATLITASTPGSYYLTITDKLGCKDTSEAVIVTVSKPDAFIDPSGTINICPGTGSTTLQAPLSDHWQQKSSFASKRKDAVGFSIADKGYIGTGDLKADFWEFDPSINTWTQRADFAGGARTRAVGFSIGNYGYIGTGYNGTTLLNDFWEYNPITNEWTQKMSFPGPPRDGAVGFNIAAKGYIGTGRNGAAYFKDFWEYTPSKNKWYQKTDFTGVARYKAVGIGVADKGYIGTGINGATRFKDFWQYNPVNDVWTSRATFPGTARFGAVGFSIANKGYLGTGEDVSVACNDFWQYNPTLNAWLRKADFSGTARYFSTGFSIQAKGYIGIGFDGSNETTDFWEYDPGYTYSWSNGANTSSINVTSAGNFTVTLTDVLNCTATSEITKVTQLAPVAQTSPSGTVNVCTGSSVSLYASTNNSVWRRKADVGTTPRWEAAGFSIGSKGYIGTGLTYAGFKKDFWEYDPVTNIWTQKADFGGVERSLAVGFNILTKGYIGTGHNAASIFTDFWEYDPAANIWNQKADCGGGGRYHATGFGVGAKGFVGLGYKPSLSKDFFEFDPITNSWTQRPDFPGAARAHASGMGILDKGYIGAGSSDAVRYNDFWEYDPATLVWTQKASIGTIVRCCSFAFSIDDKGYLGSGFAPGDARDFWEYLPEIDTWTRKADVGGNGRTRAISFAIDGKGYAGTGGSNYKNDFWEYSVDTSSFLWSSGQSTPSISVNSPGSYSVTVTSAEGCTAISSPITIIHSNPQSEITPAGPITVCLGDTISLSAVFPPKGLGAWKQKANFAGSARFEAVGFSIGTKGYIGTGRTGGSASPKNDFWEYNPVTNVWTQKVNFAGASRSGAVGFSIGSKGYIGTGNDGIGFKNDFWEYDPITNTWIQKANFGGTPRIGAVGFSIGSKGYIGTGYSGSVRYDFWEYDPGTNIWTQKTNVGGGPRTDAVGFSIGAKGYIGTGNSGSYRNDFWEYDPLTNAWLTRANVGGTVNSRTTGFAIAGNGYLCTGINSSTLLWKYDPVLNTWSQSAAFPGGVRADAIAFDINNKGYLGTGMTAAGNPLNTFWEYDPQIYTLLWSTAETDSVIAVTGAGNYTVTVIAPGGCSTTSAITVVDVNTTNIWAGGGSNNWNKAANWSCGVVPNHPQVNAIINNNAVPMPILNENVLVRDLTLNGNATVGINGNTFTINRTITGTGTLRGSSSSNLILKGAAGTVRFAAAADTLKDLLLTDTATATLGTSLNIAAGASAGSVTVNTNAALITNGNLTLKSDVNGTARVGILTGKVLGDVTVERFINTGNVGNQHAKSWQFLSTPTTNQTIKQSWQENNTTPAGFGTIITGTGTGFDITTVLPSLKFFNDVAVNWTGVTNTNTALQNKLGYMLFVRGDRTVITSGGTANNTNMRSKGTIFQPTNPPASVPVAINKFQTFGNPYASRIEFSKVRAASTGINDVFYVWDPILPGSYNVGGYQTITGVAGYIPTVGTPPIVNAATALYSAGVASPYIESGQAVFVKGSGTGGNVNFNENVKVSGSRLVNKTSPANNNLANRGFIFATLFTNSGLIADGNIVAFEDGLSNDINENDAEKILNIGENFGIERTGSLLAVEARDMVAEADTIFYRLQNLKQLTYQFRFAPVNMPASLTGFLIDRYLNTSTPISITDSSFIDFTITADLSSNATDRFMLVFKQATVVPVKIISVSAIRNTDQNQMVSVRWNVANETNLSVYKVERSEDSRTFTVLGETQPTNNNGGSAAYYYQDEQAPQKDIYYRIKAISNDGRVQYSAIVKVQGLKIAPSIAVFPNPVLDNKINIRFIDQPAGNYDIQLTNKLGQVLYNTSIFVEGANVVKTIQPFTLIPSGSYQLSVTAEDGKKTVETLVVQ